MHVNIYRPQRSCGKIIFSEACVKNSVHRVGGGMCDVAGGGCVWQGVCVEGGCMAGRHAWCGGGACMAGGVHGRGHAWQRGAAWEERWQLQLMVRILLECILVSSKFNQSTLVCFSQTKVKNCWEKVLSLLN